MNTLASNLTQFSLIPLFGDFGHPDADKFNSAFDIWNESFGEYVTLLRFKPSITAVEQTRNQVNALLYAVSNPAKLHELLGIDTGSEKLNNMIRRFICGAQMANMDMQFSAARKAAAAIKTANQEPPAMQENRSMEILRLLELEEKLLAHESEFKTEIAANKSLLIKQSLELSHIKPVITKKSIWIWGREYANDLMRFDQVIFDENGKAKEGHFINTFVLTFEKVEA